MKVVNRTHEGMFQAEPTNPHVIRRLISLLRHANDAYREFADFLKRAETIEGLSKTSAQAPNAEIVDRVCISLEQIGLVADASALRSLAEKTTCRFVDLVFSRLDDDKRAEAEQILGGNILPSGIDIDLDQYRFGAMFVWAMEIVKITDELIAQFSHSRNFSDLIERLITGPDDAKLTPIELVQLEDYLKLSSPASVMPTEQESSLASDSETCNRRNKLKLIRDFNRRLQATTPPACDEEQAELRNDSTGTTVGKGGGVNSTVPKPKRSTVRKEGQRKLIAALKKHHKYADGSCLNLEPIGNNELAKAVGVSTSTASEFFRKQFRGWAIYRANCNNNPTLLAAKLSVLCGDAQKKGLAHFGCNPPDHDARNGSKGRQVIRKQFDRQDDE